MTTQADQQTDATSLVDRYARHLAAPAPPTPDEPWLAQSLAQGAAGTALLHIERAHNGQGTWQQAHTWITGAVAGQISAADTAGLFLGAPAVAFMLHATAPSTTRYGEALRFMDMHVEQLAHRRAKAAMARIGRGELPTFHEYDIFYGLTGIAAYLLRRRPGGAALDGVLRYLVALTEPLPAQGQHLPGWWVGHDPHLRTSPHYPGGHANLGAAHGITGPLLLLSQSMRCGITVDGQREAIDAICAWLDAWKQTSATGPWWPECVNLTDVRNGGTSQSGPARPSWCYGTPGIARAGQLAGIATGNLCRQQTYEKALHSCLTDAAQLARVIDASLCHGWAGVYQTAWRAARDAASPELRQVLSHLAESLTRRAGRPGSTGHPGFLEGDAGTALALTTAAQDAAPISGWDACLLID